MRTKIVTLAIATIAMAGCSGQQVREAALFTAGAALKAAIEIDEANDERVCAIPYDGDPVFVGTSPDFVTSGPTCDAMLDAAEEYRTAQRRSELSTALDAYVTAAPGAEPDQRSVVLSGSDPVVPPSVADRFNDVVTEASSED